MGNMVRLVVASKKVYPKGDLPRQLLPVPCTSPRPRPSGEPLLTYTSTGDPPTLPGGFGSVSCRVTSPFLWVLVYTRFCFIRDPGVSGPPVLWEFCNQILLAFKVRFPGDSQSLCWVPRLGSLTWGSKPSQQWENFFGVLVLPFVGHPPRGYGIWFYHNCAPPTI